MNIEMRPMTLDDYMEFAKAKPKTSVWGVSVFADGKLAAIVGAMLHKNHTLLFSDIAPWVSAPKKTIVVWAKKVMQEMAKRKEPLFATSEKSGKLLQTLGFRFVGTKNNHNFYEYIG
jgi:hypothetical protein